MMKLETANRQDWQGFSRLLEVMSFVDEVDSFNPEETREILERLCQIPPCPGQTMSMEEVVFWAGVAVGMQLSQHAEDGSVDAETAEKVFIFSSIFEHSTKNAIVDLALGDIEAPRTSAYQKTGR
ncbi:MAG: hypothetical protein DMG92_15295 [Acidobacteria bacterium]|nr:MAG: hypothetical protein DMG92_15295 [Acidobacteriota bacterium]